MRHQQGTNTVELYKRPLSVSVRLFWGGVSLFIFAPSTLSQDIIDSHFVEITRYIETHQGSKNQKKKYETFPTLLLPL